MRLSHIALVAGLFLSPLVGWAAYNEPVAIATITGMGANVAAVLSQAAAGTGPLLAYGDPALPGLSSNIVPGTPGMSSTLSLVGNSTPGSANQDLWYVQAYMPSTSSLATYQKTTLFSEALAHDPSTLGLINATAMINGVSYQIATVGTTTFTSYGSPSNIVGQTFTATGPGTGTGTVYTPSLFIGRGGTAGASICRAEVANTACFGGNDYALNKLGLPASMVGREIDVAENNAAVTVGSTPVSSTGLQIVSTGVYNGTAAELIAGGWQDGIVIASTAGYAIRVPAAGNGYGVGEVDAFTVNSSGAVSASAFASSRFSVDGSGNVTSHSFTTASMVNSGLTGLMYANGASAVTAIAPGTGVVAALGHALDAASGLVSYSSLASDINTVLSISASVQSAVQNATNAASGLVLLNSVKMAPIVGTLASGSAPTGSTGTCTASSFTGGTLAGTFSAAVCAAGTFILSGLPTATNGYACFASNRTHIADLLVETATSATSATFTATTAASDTVQFACTGY